MITSTSQTTQTYSDYIEFLQNTTVKELDFGAYAYIFKHPTDKDKIVKVFPGEQDRYHLYLKWCLKNQENKFVPKIYEYHEFMLEDRFEIGVVFLEKLKSMSSAKYKNFHSSNLLAIENKKYVDAKFFRPSKTLDKDFRAVLRFLWSAPAEFDFHDGNFMLRDEQIVVTDPLF